MNKLLTRILSLIGVVLAISIFFLFVLGKVNAALFWTVIIFTAILAYFVIPRLNRM